MNMKKNIYTPGRCSGALAGMVLCALLFSCVSEQHTDPAMLQTFEYSNEQIRRSEIDEIEKIRAENPVPALARADVLYKNASDDEAVRHIFDTCVEQVSGLLTQELADEKSNGFRAWQLYTSLAAVSAQYVQTFPVTADTLYEKAAMQYLSELKQPSDAAEGRISQYIDGTVTVWVDLGLKVEKGMGFAERVIGSGFFIDPRGYIITNHHVISNLVDPSYKGFSRLYIKVADDPDTRIPAKVIGWDPALDLALIKTEIDAPYVFALGSSSALDIGERIYAIGSPVGLEKTMTSGIISAIDRKLLAIASVMQIDAAVNSGNSGGPIIDNNGNVQAVVFAGMENFEGLNFAIPVEYLKMNLAALYRGGKIEHSWIGAYGRTKKEYVSSKDGIGVEVLYTMPGGSAWRAGIEPGDTIVSVAGIPVTTIEQMQNLFLSIMPDMLVPVECIGASGEKATRNVYLDTRPERPGESFYNHDTVARVFYPLFGMELTSVSENRKKFAIKTIVRGSIADESGFSENDPVDILKTKMIAEDGVLYAELFTKKRKSGYLDISVGVAAPLDSPYFF